MNEEPTLFDAISALPTATQETLREIESFIEYRKRENYIQLIFDLATIVGGTNKMMSYTALINLGRALVRPEQKNLSLKWCEVPEEPRMTLRHMLMHFLTSDENRFRDNAAYCCWGLVNIEYRAKLWDNFFGDLWELSKPDAGPHSVHGWFCVMKYVLENDFLKVVPEPTRQAIIGEIHRVSFFYLDQEWATNEIRTQAIQNILTGIHLFDEIAAAPEVLTGMIVTVLRNLVVPDEEVHQAVYELLGVLYVRKFDMLDENMVKMVWDAVKPDFESEDEARKDLAINFWTKFAMETSAKGKPEILKLGSEYLIYILLRNLSSPKPYDESDPIQVKLASMLCLEEIMKALGEPNMTIISFYGNLVSENPVARHAALLAIYSSIGIYNIDQILDGRFSIIVDLSNDADLIVQESAIQVLAKIYKTHPERLASVDDFNGVMGRVVVPNMGKSVKVVRSVFDLLHDIFNTFDGVDRRTTLCSLFDPIFDLFSGFISTEGARDLEVMKSCFEALNAFISHLIPELCGDKIIRVLEIVLTSINNELSSELPMLNTHEFVVYLCSVISTIILTVGELSFPYADDIMTKMCQIMSSGILSVDEEVLVTICCLADKLKDGFQKYEDVVFPLVMERFETRNEQIICQAAKLISIMFKFPTPHVLSMIGAVYSCVLSAAESKDIRVHMKTYIVEAVVSVASRMETDFYRISIDLLVLLRDAQRSVANTNTSHSDEREYAIRMMEIILDGYIVITEIDNDPDKSQVIRNIKQIMESLDIIEHQSICSFKILDSFMKLTYRIVDCGRSHSYNVCSYISKSTTISRLTALVRESGHEKLIADLEKLGAAITAVLTRGF